jgi:O-antigen ligase
MTWNDLLGNAKRTRGALLFLVLMPFLIAAASMTGPASLVVLVLVVSTFVAFLFPVVIPVAVLFLSPLLGRVDESIFGSLGGTEVLAAWFLLIGCFILLVNMDKIYREKLVIILILIVIVALFSVPKSTMRMRSLTEVIRIIGSFIMLPLAMLLGQRLRDRKWIIYSIILSSFVPLSVGLYQKLTGDVSHIMKEGIWIIESGLLRIYSTFWDVHPYAKYLLILVPLTALMFREKGRSAFYKVSLAYLFSLSFFELIFTYARSELVGVMTAAVAVLYALKKLSLKSLAYFIPVLLILMAVFYVSGVFERFADVLHPIDLQTGVRESTLESRAIIWIKGFPLALESPIWGHGANTFEDAIGIESHNDYLGLFYDIGIGGPILYALFFFVAFRRTLKMSRFKELDEFDRAVILTSVGLTLAIAVTSFVENLFTATVMWWFYFAVLGCALAAFRNPADENDVEPGLAAADSGSVNE